MISPSLTLDLDIAETILHGLLKELMDLQAGRTVATSIQYRITMLGRASKILYRLAAVRKTMCAMRIDAHSQVTGLTLLNSELKRIHCELQSIQSRLPKSSKQSTPPPTPTPAPTPSATTPIQVTPIPRRNSVFSPAGSTTTAPELNPDIQSTIINPQSSIHSTSVPSVSSVAKSAVQSSIINPTAIALATAVQQSAISRSRTFTRESKPTPAALIRAIPKMTPRPGANPCNQSNQPGQPNQFNSQDPAPICLNPFILRPRISKSSIINHQLSIPPSPPDFHRRISNITARFPSTIRETPAFFPETAKSPRPYFPLLNLDLLSRVRTVHRQPMIFLPLQAPLFTPHPDSAEIHFIKTDLDRNQSRQADQIKARWKTQFPNSYEYIYGRYAPPPD